jgi:hypothetical protein
MSIFSLDSWKKHKRQKVAAPSKQNLWLRGSRVADCRGVGIQRRGARLGEVKKRRLPASLAGTWANYPSHRLLAKIRFPHATLAGRQLNGGNALACGGVRHALIDALLGSYRVGGAAVQCLGQGWVPKRRS